jgi:glycosyltransferase involved in cell wall biosynthesis
MTAARIDGERRARPGARRVLHVVRQMHAGGIAVWLMNVLRHINRARYHMDFLLVHEGPAAYASEIRGLGSSITPCLGYHNPWRFAGNFARILHGSGPYDVVHSHLYNYSGFVLKLAARHEVPVRIAQSHTDTRLKEANQGRLRQVYRRAYLDVTRHWLRRHATAGLAVSRGAADALFGADWVKDPRFRVLPLGLDFKPFSAPYDQGEVRRSLGLPADALVIGHVGNYVWHKNHDFLLETARQILANEPRAWLLLVGHGLIGSHVEKQVQALGLTDRVLIAGARDDVPRLMVGAMDAFLFPSHYEGLGLVLLEAQAAGLPCILTDSLPREVDVVPELVHRLSLQASPATWASASLNAARERPLPQQATFAQIAASDFAIENAVQQLTRVYDQGGAA